MVFAEELELTASLREGGVPDLLQTVPPAVSKAVLI